MQKTILISLVFSLISIQKLHATDTLFETDSLSPHLSYVVFNEGDYISSLMVSHGPDGILLIDNGSVINFYSILNNFGGVEALKYVILTHWHFDHVRGDSLLNKRVKVISHPLTRDYLSAAQELLGMKINAQPADVLPSVLISSPTGLLFNGDSLRLIPAVGHTGGDLLVYFPTLNILHVGDIVFADMFAFYDIAHGGNVKSALKTIHYIIDQFPEQTLIIPSHGRYYTMADIRIYGNMLENVIKEVDLCKKREMNLQEMKEKKILNSWAEFAKGFTCEDMIEYVFQSLE